MNRSLPFDWQLAPYDILQSQAHARGAGPGRRPDREPRRRRSAAGLERVRARIEAPGFAFEESDEDIHMAIERLLGEEIGALAGKLHTGRSRNDQVATDIAMVVNAASRRAMRLCAEAMERLLGARRDPPRLADARLHPSAARPAGLPRPSPARLLLDALAATSAASPSPPARRA